MMEESPTVLGGGLHQSLHGLLQQGGHAPPKPGVPVHDSPRELSDAHTQLSTATTSMRSSPHNDNELEDEGGAAQRPQHSRSPTPEPVAQGGGGGSGGARRRDGRRRDGRQDSGIRDALFENVLDAQCDCKDGSARSGKVAKKKKAGRKRGHQQPQLPRVAALCVDRRFVVAHRDECVVPDLARSEADFFRGVFTSPRCKPRLVARPSTAMGIQQVRAGDRRGQGENLRQETVERSRNSFNRLAIDPRFAHPTTSTLEVIQAKQVDGTQHHTKEVEPEKCRPVRSGALGMPPQEVPAEAFCSSEKSTEEDPSFSHVLMHPVTATVQINSGKAKPGISYNFRGDPPSKRMSTRPQSAHHGRSMRAGDPNKFSVTCLGPGPAAYDISSQTHDASLHPGAKTIKMATTKRGSFLDPFLSRSKAIPPPGAYDNSFLASDPGNTSIAMRATRTRRAPSATFSREERVCCLLSKNGPSEMCVGYDDIRMTPFRKWM